MRLLLVEDSERLQRSLGTGLRKAHYAVDITGDGEEGLWYAESHDYDVIILDLMLPKMDGLTLLRRLRAQQKQTHVLILTARDRVEDRVLGLQTGADDYLVKPFAFDELLARVQALCRRAYGKKDSLIAIAGLEIDTASRTVFRGGDCIPLAPREYVLLEYLAQRAGEVVTRTEIETHIYDDDPSKIAQKMDGVVAGLLAMVRCEEGRMALQSEPVAPGLLLEKIWPGLEAKAAAKELRALFDVPPNLLVRSDPAALEIILTNVLSNAVEYSPTGGQLRWTTQNSPGQVAIICTNSAPDLTAEDLPHLCERFWRKDAARHDSTHSGLGLAIARQFAQLVGAKMELHLNAQAVLELTLIFPDAPSEPRVDPVARESSASGLAALARPACLLAICLLTGCVSYRPAPLSPERTAQDWEARRLEGSRRWNLATLTTAAYRFHPDLEVARAQLGTARAALLTAGERPNPTVTVSPQFTTPITPFINGTYGVDFDVPIETAGKRGKRLAQARAQADSARFAVANTLWQIRSRLRKSLLDLHAANAHVELLSREDASQNEIVALTLQQAEAGEIAQPQLLQSRLLANQTRLLLAEAEKQQGESRAAVAEAAGVSTRAIEAVQLDLSEFDRRPGEVPVRKLRRGALMSRADVLGALADYAAAEAALRLEIAKQYPDLHLAPGYVFDQGANKWQVGLSVTLPILNQNRGAISEAMSRRREAAAKFVAVQTKAIGELERALASYRGALKKLAVADGLLGAQEKQLGAAQSLLKAGETDRLTLTSAQLERDSAAVSRLETLIEVQLALGALEDAAQTILQ